MKGRRSQSDVRLEPATLDDRALKANYAQQALGQKGGYVE